ncbi:MAG: hypothetical protein HY825_19330 [Acidobacteria bacterium]|nr:hypothetical protein [Acidobacteriota bacterium]
MKLSRLVAFSTLGLAALAAMGCYGGNSTADTQAAVLLTVDLRSAPADIDMSLVSDVTVSQMTITSQSKVPGMTLSQQQDVILREWVVTCTRSDGGTVTSRQWRNFENVSVPANGSATLQNYRIFPGEYFRETPLAQLFPENGGYDAETGKRNVRQALRVDIYGTTLGGERVVASFPINLNFFYGSY